MSRKRILYILHCYYNRAGTEEHTRDLATGLKGFDTYIAFPDRARVVLMHQEKEIAEYPATPIDWPVTPYRSAQHEEALNNIIDTVKPDLIHIQHFIHWHLGVIDQLVKTRVPVALSFHDYYPLTPEYTMRGVSDESETLKASYAKKVFGKDISDYLKERRSIISESITSVSLRITPSEYLAGILKGSFDSTYRVIPHGIHPFEVLPATPSEILRFGYIGSLLPQKGYTSLISGFQKALASGLKATLTLFGDGTDVKKVEYPGIVYNGSYTRDDLPKIMTQFDIGIIPSVFAETFSLVLSEMWHAKKPVAASQIGAIPERVKNGETGLLFSPGNDDEIAKALLSLQQGSEWKKWQIPVVRLLSDMLQEYQVVYNSLLKGSL